MFSDAVKVGGKSRYNSAKTSTGLKDNFLEFFTGRIFSFMSGLRGSSQEKEIKVKEMVDRDIPNEPFSPVWRIKG